MSVQQYVQNDGWPVMTASSSRRLQHRCPHPQDPAFLQNNPGEDGSRATSRCAEYES